MVRGQQAYRVENHLRRRGRRLPHVRLRLQVQQPSEQRFLLQ